MERLIKPVGLLPGLTVAPVAPGSDAFRDRRRQPDTYDLQRPWLRAP